MKQITIFFIFIFLLTGISTAEGITEPKWSDFCPEEYLEASKADTDKNEAYWYGRRLQFKQSLSKCKIYEGRELKNCYNNLISEEESKNSKWGSFSNAYGESLERGREQSNSYNINSPMSYGFSGIINAIRESE